MTQSPELLRTSANVMLFGTTLVVLQHLDAAFLCPTIRLSFENAVKKVSDDAMSLVIAELICRLDQSILVAYVVLHDVFQLFPLRFTLGAADVDNLSVLGSASVLFRAFEARPMPTYLLKVPELIDGRTSASQQRVRDCRLVNVHICLMQGGDQASKDGGRCGER